MQLFVKETLVFIVIYIMKLRFKKFKEIFTMKKNYRFHFIVTEAYNSIMLPYLMESFGTKKLSTLFEKMFSLFNKNLPRIKQIIGDHRSEYTLIADLKEERVDKFGRLNKENYLLLKKWHYKFNEFGMAGMMRDMILFFYNGINQYGVDKFIELISKKLKVGMIIVGTRDKMAQLLSIFAKKLFLLQNIIDNFIEYT